jgi:hypothetical protein
MSSDTPLTDAEPKASGRDAEYFELVKADFTRTLERRVSQLEAQLAEARKDSDRLDWLLSDSRVSVVSPTQLTGACLHIFTGPRHCLKFGRAAIDAAMNP